MNVAYRLLERAHDRAADIDTRKCLVPMRRWPRFDAARDLGDARRGIAPGVAQGGRQLDAAKKRLRELLLARGDGMVVRIGGAISEVTRGAAGNLWLAGSRPLAGAMPQ